MESPERSEPPAAELVLQEVAAHEREFFGHYYGERRYHPTGWRLRQQRDLRVLCAAAPDGRLGRVLSVGCGDGAFELMLAERADSVVGVDISPEAIELARSAKARAAVSNVDFRCLSVLDLDGSEQFDTIVCVALLHHVPAAALRYFLSMTFRHLRPGGLFYSQDPNIHGFMRFVGRRVLGANYDKYHSRDERELDPAEVVDGLTHAGFRSISVRPIDVTLIPALHFFQRGPGAIMYGFALFDRLWAATPLGRWASGFSVIARRPDR